MSKSTFRFCKSFPMVQGDWSWSQRIPPRLIDNMKSRSLLFACGIALLFGLPSVSNAQIASALIREGDTLPGDSSGFLISNINIYNTQNGVGGYAFNVETFDAAGTGEIDHIWGNTTGGSGTVLRTQTTIGNFEQTGIYQIGMSDAGALAYRGISNDTLSGTTNMWGAWVDSSLVLNERDPIANLPGNFSTASTAVDITRDGTPYWKGGYSPNLGDSTGAGQAAIFFGTEQTVLLRDGDAIVGVSETVAASYLAIDLDLRFSALGNSYISQVLVESGSLDNDGIIVSNGAALLAGGSVIREQSLIPTSVGGLAGERYDNFDRLGITESGSFMITGNTDAAETLAEFIMIDGEILLRDGDVVDGLTLNGDIESAYQNEDGDWAAIWDVDFGANNLEALIMNGEILLLEGGLVDWNNDGLVDGLDQNGFITDFSSGNRGLTLSDRDANGNVRLLFNADIDLNGTLLEGGFSMSVSTVPEPSSLFVLLLASGPMLARRRRII